MFLEDRDDFHCFCAAPILIVHIFLRDGILGVIFLVFHDLCVLSIDMNYQSHERGFSAATQWWTADAETKGNSLMDSLPTICAESR